MGSEANVPSALCIAGMHRSGTSLVSSLLQSGGLDIGQRLVKAGRGNVKGHFEDLDFNEWHMRILKSQAAPASGFTLQQGFRIRASHAAAARALVEERRRRLIPWGWKDPRTALFLDFWRQLVPEAHFLILFRCPWDVVDSLFRRGDEPFRTNPRFAVELWIHYNQLLLDFHDRFPERCLCLNSYEIVQSPSLPREVLARKFGLRLEAPADLYDDSLLHRLETSPRAALLQQYFPQALDLYAQLNERAAQSLSVDKPPIVEPDTLLPAEDSAFQDWLNLRVLEEKHRGVRAELEESEAELARVRDELHKAQTRVFSLGEELQELRRQLHQSQRNLDDAQTQLQDILEQIANMESSKFWKLRLKWLAAKEYLRRAG